MESREKNITIEEVENIFYHLLSEGQSTALWKLPDTDTIHFITSEDKPELLDESIIDLVPGFIIAPFDAHAHHQYYFIKNDHHLNICLSDKKITQNTFFFNTDKMSKQNVKENIFRYLTNINSTKESINSFTRNVTTALGEIASGTFKKVVLSRSASFPSKVSLNIFKKFIQLAESHPSSFTSLTFIPNVGLWIGATPEVLIKKTKHNQFSTMALAGTQPSNGANEKEAVWKQKEIEEQAYVSRYIINRFKEIRLREFDDIGPRTVKAGELFHLQTDIIVDMDEVGMLDLPEIMRKALHPTSAVCGMPKLPALTWLKQHEGYDRKLYSGYLGPVNMENETTLFVNLRCAEVHRESITLYAGAGITADSIPEKELEETTLKMKTLEKILLD